jgi:Anti-sigma-D factor RsdA to sigma factor binding region
VHDLDDVWRDDQLIEALASGQPVDTTDPATAPLRALTGLVDAAPIPDYDVRDLENLGNLHNLVMLDTGRSRRVAVRSLAVALTAVATLSTSGVAAVVTGDPFQPAKVVWHQIQERAGDRWGADPTDDEERLDSGSAIGGDSGTAAGTADTGDASGAGTDAQAQSAVFEAARQAQDPSRLQRVSLPRQPADKAATKDGLEAGQAPSQDRAVATADATDEPQVQPSPAQEDTAAEERRARQDERSSGTSTTEPTEPTEPTDDSANQRQDAQRSEEEQKSQDSRRSDQPEEDEQEPTPEAPSDELDPGIVPESPDEDPTDGYGSMRSTEDDSDDAEESDEDSDTSDGTAFSDSVPDEGTSSTEESTAEEPEDDGSWTGLRVQKRAGSTDETVAPPRLNR